jgi:predicted tellurium resistance membrane protein TerC
MNELYIFLAKFLTITGLEITLSVDNVIFITVLANKLSDNYKRLFVISSLLTSLIMKLLLLFGIGQVTLMKNTLFTIASIDLSISSLMYFIGGGILIIRAFMEIHDMLHHNKHEPINSNEAFHLNHSAISTILLINFVLALDTVFIGITITQEFWLVASAIVISVITLITIANKVINFLNSNISLRVTALSFMIFLGGYLIISGFSIEMSKKYLYAALGFTLLVQILTAKITNKTLRA